MTSKLEGNLNIYDDRGELVAVVHDPKHPTYYAVKKMTFDDILQLQGGVQLPHETHGLSDAEFNLGANGGQGGTPPTKQTIYFKGAKKIVGTLQALNP